MMTTSKNQLGGMVHRDTVDWAVLCLEAVSKLAVQGLL